MDANTEGQAPVVNEEVGQAPVDDTGSQLPSDVKEANDALANLDFSLNDSVKEKYLTKDGKLLGKYETLEQLAEAHKYLQDKHAMYVDDTKKQEKEVGSEIAQQQAQAKQQETIKSLIPEFMANNMELTPELEQKVIDAGVDIRDVKLGAIEIREKVNHVHDLVGGKENWEATKAYLGSKMSEADFAKINEDLMGANSDYTVLGMYNAYKASLDGSEPKARINGDSITPKAQSGYQSRAQLYADRQYLNTPAGKKDTVALSKYRAKLGMTDLGSLGIKA